MKLQPETKQKQMKIFKKIMAGLFALFLIAVAWIGYHMFFSSKSHVGIDVSHHNKLSARNWNKLEGQGISFVYIKVSEGDNYRDPKAKSNSIAASDHKMLIGTYHFFRDNVNSEKQYRNYLSARARCSWSLLPVIDYERDGFHTNVSERSRQETLKNLYLKLEKHDGQAPIIYCSIIEYFKLLRILPKAKFWLGDPNFGFGTIQQKKKNLGMAELDFDYANLADIMFASSNENQGR